MPPFRIPRASGSIVVRNCIRRVFRLNTRGSMWFIVTIACVFVIMSVTVWTWRLNRIAPKQEDVAALFSISETESQTETDADIVIEESQPQVASQVVPVPVAVPVNSELELFAKGLRNTWYTREFTEIPRSVVIAAEKVEVKGVQKKYTINKKTVNVYVEEAWPVVGSGRHCFVLLLHGSSQTSAVWKTTRTLQLLAAVGCVAFAVDLPGKGHTEKANRELFLPAVIAAYNATPSRLVIVSARMSGLYSLPYVLEPEAETCSARLAGLVALATNYSQRFSADTYGRCKIPVAFLYGAQDRKALLSLANLRHMPNSRIFPFTMCAVNCYTKHVDQWHTFLFNYLQLIGII